MERISPNYETCPWCGSEFTGGTCEHAEYVKPECKLVGTDGNVFAIIGKVSKALKLAGMTERAKEWVGHATSCHSYDEVLAAMGDYVEVR